MTAGRFDPYFIPALNFTHPSTISVITPAFMGGVIHQGEQALGVVSSGFGYHGRSLFEFRSTPPVWATPAQSKTTVRAEPQHPKRWVRSQARAAAARRANSRRLQFKQICTVAAKKPQSRGVGKEAAGLYLGCSGTRST
jgi:hypothetical protein